METDEIIPCPLPDKEWEGDSFFWIEEEDGPHIHIMFLFFEPDNIESHNIETISINPRKNLIDAYKKIKNIENKHTDGIWVGKFSNYYADKIKNMYENLERIELWKSMKSI